MVRFQFKVLVLSLLLVSLSGPTFTNTTRPESLTVISASEDLLVSPSGGLNATGIVGGPFSPTTLVYTLLNAGSTGIINWTAAKTQGWITLSAPGAPAVTPLAGTLTPGSSIKVTVSINSNAKSLVLGTYTDTVTFRWNPLRGGGQTTRTVSLAVTGSAGVLIVAPSDGFIPTGQEGGPFGPARCVYTLQNTGGTQINWTASKTQPWVTLSTESGTLGAGATARITVSINASGNSLAANTYTDTLTFTNTTNGAGNTTRPVNLTVSPIPPGVLSTTPDSGFQPTRPVDGSFNPPSIVYTLKNTGGTQINWTASKTQPWITLSAASGTLAGGATATVTVYANADANRLTVGTYTDTVTITNTTNGTGTATRPVSLTVTPPAGNLYVYPTDGLVSTKTVAGLFNPTSIVYRLQNTGGTQINWTASKTQPWITLSAAGGTLAANATATVTVSINSNADSLTTSTYTDTVTFTNTTNGKGNTGRSVSLAIPLRYVDVDFLSVNVIDDTDPLAAGELWFDFWVNDEYQMWPSGEDVLTASTGETKALPQFSQFYNLQMRNEDELKIRVKGTDKDAGAKAEVSPIDTHDPLGEIQWSQRVSLLKESQEIELNSSNPAYFSMKIRIRVRSQY